MHNFRKPKLFFWGVTILFIVSVWLLLNPKNEEDYAIYDGSSISSENPLDKAISNAMIGYNTQHWTGGGYAFESHINLAIERDWT